MLAIKPSIFQEIENLVNTLDFETISFERKMILQTLVAYIQEKKDENKEIRLNFICSHNSRRSHLAQVWAQTAAAFYDVKNVNCYSGGTQVTAMFELVAVTLAEQGFQIAIFSSGINPVYRIKYAENSHPIIGFSKIFDDYFNPKIDFAAILACSTADKDCPFIKGADERIPLPFDDPKIFDRTSFQKEKYLERSIEIATQMFYVFSQIKH